MKSLSLTRRDVVVFSIYAVLILGGSIVSFDFFHLFQQHHRDEVSFFNPILDHVLAIIAIIAGLVAVLYELKLDSNFERQRAEIQKIVESVNTRHVGDWPNHLKEITALIQDAQAGDELIVMVDSPGYGCLSAAADFKPYLSSLTEAASKPVAVKIIFHGESVALADLKKQYEKEKNNPQDLKELLVPYHDLYRNWNNASVESSVKSYENFLTAVLYTESIFCAVLTNAAKPVEVRMRPSNLPNEYCFYWLIRRKEGLKKMIFAYSVFEGAGSGYAFRTSDPKLIEIFARDFDHIWRQSPKLEPGDFLYQQAWQEGLSWKQSKDKD